MTAKIYNLAKPMFHYLSNLYLVTIYSSNFKIFFSDHSSLKLCTTSIICQISFTSLLTYHTIISCEKLQSLKNLQLSRIIYSPKSLYVKCDFHDPTNFFRWGHGSLISLMIRLSSNFLKDHNLPHEIFLWYISNEGKEIWWIKCNIIKMSDHWETFWSLMSKLWSIISWMSNKLLV